MKYENKAKYVYYNWKLKQNITEQYFERFIDSKVFKKASFLKSDLKQLGHKSKNDLIRSNLKMKKGVMKFNDKDWYHCHTHLSKIMKIKGSTKTKYYTGKGNKRELVKSNIKKLLRCMILGHNPSGLTNHTLLKLLGVP